MNSKNGLVNQLVFCTRLRLRCGTLRKKRQSLFILRLKNFCTWILLQVTLAMWADNSINAIWGPTTTQKIGSVKNFLISHCGNSEKIVWVKNNFFQCELSKLLKKFYLNVPRTEEGTSLIKPVLTTGDSDNWTWYTKYEVWTHLCKILGRSLVQSLLTSWVSQDWFTIKSINTHVSDWGTEIA